MKIVSIGGSPAGLYFSILMKKALPGADITMYERNRPADTFGWGVVFSDETLDKFEHPDPESFTEITVDSRFWKSIEDLLQRRPRGVDGARPRGAVAQDAARDPAEALPRAASGAVFEREVAGVEELSDADLIPGADGINSVVREADAAYFKARLDWRQCRFTWLGSDKPLDAFPV